MDSVALLPPKYVLSDESQNRGESLYTSCDLYNVCGITREKVHVDIDKRIKVLIEKILFLVT